MKCRICGYENDFVTRCPFKEFPDHGKTKKEHDAIKRAAEQTVEADASSEPNGSRDGTA